MSGYRNRAENRCNNGQDIALDKAIFGNPRKKGVSCTQEVTTTSFLLCDC